jgi:hypothetical protein
MASTDVLSIRFEKGTRQRLEAVRKKLVSHTGIAVTRAAVIKMLVEEGLKARESKR